MIALVTGASGGIGLELARLFAADGHDLVLVSRGAERLGVVSRDLEDRFKVEVRAIPRDLSNPIAPASLFDECGEIDFLVNNAGFGSLGTFVESDPAMLGEMLQVNVAALTQLTRLFLPTMLERRTGRILNVASTAAFLPGPLMAVYYATKAYVLSFSEAIANELAGTGVTVTALCPGPTASGFQAAAHLEESKLVAGKTLAISRAVAQEGYDAMMAGKRLIVSGFSNKLVVQMPRLLPRRVVATIVRAVQERRSGAA